MRIVALLILLLCAALPLAAQDTRPRQLVGLGAGGAWATWGLQGGAFPVFGNSTDCGEFVDATVATTWFGLSTQFPKAFSNDFGLALGVRVSDAMATYTAQPKEQLVLFDSEVGAPIEVAREYRFTIGESIIHLDLLGTWSLGGRWLVMGGGWGGLRLGTTSEQTERILDRRFLFSGDRQDTMMTNNLVPTFERFAYGLQAGGSYEIALWKKFSVQPEVMVRYDPGTQITGLSWSRVLVTGGINLLFDLVPDPVPQVEPPPPVVSLPDPPQPETLPVAPAAKLVASLDLRAVDSLERDLPAATVTIYQTHVRRVLPFPRAVDFAPNSATLGSGYRRLVTAIPSQQLVDSLASAPRDIIEAHMLNLLGLRLRENPIERISLTGATARDEATWLAYARVESVRSYLESVWGIDGERIDVQAAPERTRRGGRSVMISGSERILGPIDLLRVDREFEPPRIRIAPQWEATAGVRNWGISFHHGLSEIGSFDSRQNSGTSISALDWQIVNRPSGRGVEPLSAELTVVDSAGSSIRAVDTLPLRLDRRSRLVYSRIDDNNRERVIYTLYPESAVSRNQELISTIVRSIPAGAELAVGTGSGNRERGAEMIAALRRAAASRGGVRLARQPVQLDAEALALPGSEENDISGSIALVIDLPPRR